MKVKHPNGPAGLQTRLISWGREGAGSLLQCLAAGFKLRASLLAGALLLLVGAVRAEIPLVPQWMSYAGVAEGTRDAVYATLVDADTNVYFAGRSFYGQLKNASEIGPRDYIGDSLDVDGSSTFGFVAAADAAGQFAWLTALGQGSPSAVRAMAATSNALYVVGSYSDETLLATKPTSFTTDAFLAKLSKTDGSYSWTSDADPTRGERWLLYHSPAEFVQPTAESAYTAVAVDPADGSVYAAGYTTLTNLNNIGDTVIRGGRDAVIVKYTSEGNLWWIRTLGGNAADAATAIAVDSTGTVYLAGTTASTNFFIGTNRLKRASSTTGSFLARLTANGTISSCVFLESVSGAVTANALALGAHSNQLLVAGATAATNFPPRAANTYSGAGDGFVMSFNPTTFATNWSRFIGGVSNDSVRALAALPNGRFTLAGVTASPGFLPTEANLSSFAGGTDGFVLQLSAGGAPVLGAYTGGARADSMNAIAFLDTNTFALAGETVSLPNESSLWIFKGFASEWQKPSEDAVDTNLTNSTYGVIGLWSLMEGTAPVITNDLTDITCYEGESVTFSVAASGTAPFRYRWFTNDVALASTTNAAYTLASAAPTASGSTYRCTVSNYFGGATSRVARLTVIANGSLTVTFTNSPAAARWSIDGGATWLAGGATLSLRPASYTLACAAVDGWTAPAAETLAITAGAAATRLLSYTPVTATAARTIVSTNVTLAVTADAAATGWMLVETIPGGLTPTNFSAAATWSDSAHTLTFTGTATTAILAYSVVAVTSGCWTVSGAIAAHPSEAVSAVAGDTRLIKANLVRVISGTTITITTSTAKSKWKITDIIPAALAYTNAVPETIDDTENELFWIVTGGSTITYKVLGAPGSYTINGNDSNGELIFGDSVVTILAPPVPNILSFSLSGSAFALSFTSAVNQVYWVETNSVLATNGWADCLSVTGASALTTATLPTNGPTLFYRIKQE